MIEAAALCQRNMRDWYLARIDAASGSVAGSGALAWANAGTDLVPAGSGRIIPFPGTAEESDIEALLEAFDNSGPAPVCTLGEPLTPRETRLALKKTGFHYLFAALCMARLDSFRPPRVELEGIEIRECRDHRFAEEETHPSYGPLSDEAPAATLRAALVLASGADPRLIILGAFDGDRNVGWVTLFCNRDSAGIYDLGTSQSYRRRGIGGALIAAAIAAADALGHCNVVLQNDASLEKLYELYDFRRVGVIEHWQLRKFLPPPPEADLLIEDFASAIATFDVERLRNLVQTSPNLVNRQLPGSGATPLHLAAYHGSDGALELMLENQAGVNVRDGNHGATPLYWALYGLSSAGPVFKRAQLEIAERLIAAGAEFGPAERDLAATLAPEVRSRIEAAVAGTPGG